MLFGTGRLFQNSATPLVPYTALGMTNSVTLPGGSQAGDICIHHITRSVTSEGTPPNGFTAIHRESLGAIGHVAWYAKILNSTDISNGAVTGGVTTSIVNKWTYVTRPVSPVTSISSERLETADSSGSTLPKLTMAGTFTRPAIVMANALARGANISTKADIVNGINKSYFNPETYNSVVFENVSTSDSDAARATNQPTLTNSVNYFHILVAIRAI